MDDSKNPEEIKPIISVTTEVPTERIAEALVCAFEGGSTYWCGLAGAHVGGVSCSEAVRRGCITREHAAALGDFRHYVAPFLPDGYVTLRLTDPMDEDATRVRLTREGIERGASIMASAYPEHWGRLIALRGDAHTGDIFLQLAVFGELVYG